MHRLLLEQRIGYLANKVDEGLEFSEFMLDRIDQLEDERSASLISEGAGRR